MTRRPFTRAQRVAARRLMHFAALATTALPGSVEQWDHRTSANDARAALSIALGKRLDSIDPARGTA